jgi:hypothetical protein
LDFIPVGKHLLSKAIMPKYLDKFLSKDSSEQHIFQVYVNFEPPPEKNI